MSKFLYFVGPYINSLNVAVYESAHGRRSLRPEACNGAAIPGATYKTVSAEEYADLRGVWTNNGRIASDDVRVTQRALASLGVALESDD